MTPARLGGGPEDEGLIGIYDVDPEPLDDEQLALDDDLNK